MSDDLPDPAGHVAEARRPMLAFAAVRSEPVPARGSIAYFLEYGS